MASTPVNHAREAQHRIDELVRILRDGVMNDPDPRGQALYETSAEVVLGVRKALSHYQNKDEAAWRDR